MPENVSPPSPNGQNQEDKKTRFNLYTWLFDNPERFFWVIVLLGILGGLAALMVPNCIDWQISSNNSAESKADEIRQKSISDLRLHILYITGGIIAILTLLQNSWKNQIDRRKIEDDIQKNKNDHIRQVHAERRSRYTKAVEQLANEKAAVRLGGIYTLVGLADEWLADDSLTKDKQNEEGQVIINNLCSYIRSPFPLAEKIDEYKAYKKLEELKKKESENLLKKVEQFELKALVEPFTNSQDYKEPEDITADYVTFHEEQDVRRTIFVEMGKRSSVISNKEEGDVTGAWSDFDFDFSQAHIFYSFYKLTIEKGNFSGAKFYAGTDFSKATFNNEAHFGGTTFNNLAHFGGATFNNEAYFGGATFNNLAHFGEATFNNEAHFGEATFNNLAHFGEATFNNEAHFGEATFNNITLFDKATFNNEAHFGEATFNNLAGFGKTTFNNLAHFGEATFNNEAYFGKTTFNNEAHFGEATFNNLAGFRETTFNNIAGFGKTTFNDIAHFGKATFTGNVDFGGTEFSERADFWSAEFSGDANFKDSYFEKYAPIFVYDSSAARFSNRVNWADSNFSVRSGSQPIELGSATLGDKTFSIPFGTVVFDPGSWDEKTEEYTHMSVTCCRIRRSPHHQE